MRQQILGAVVFEDGALCQCSFFQADQLAQQRGALSRHACQQLAAPIGRRRA